jgi:hypothetical protein
VSWPAPPAAGSEARRGARALAAGLVAVALVLSFGCASVPKAAAFRDFPSADPAARERSLRAWDEAVKRADSLPPSRLLYDLKYSKGAVRASGTLAIVAGSKDLTAAVTGPFGAQLGEYRDGAFRLKDQEPLRVDARLLRGILAGVWKGGAPEIVGADSGQSLLRWQAAGSVVIDAVLELSDARLRFLRARGPNGELSVAFPDGFSPWPDVVEIVSTTTGQTLRLTKDFSEPIRD